MSADPDDEYLIDLARAVAADVLAAGDRHLLDLTVGDGPGEGARA